LKSGYWSIPKIKINPIRADKAVTPIAADFRTNLWAALSDFKAMAFNLSRKEFPPKWIKTSATTKYAVLTINKCEMGSGFISFAT
jgi:hypothetical protein